MEEGWPIDPRLLDDDDPLFSDAPAICPGCHSGGPAQYGRRFHCNQCGYEWQDVRTWRLNPDIIRCTAADGEILVWDEGRRLWIGTESGDLHRPRDEQADN